MFWLVKLNNLVWRLRAFESDPDMIDGMYPIVFGNGDHWFIILFILDKYKPFVSKPLVLDLEFRKFNSYGCHFLETEPS
jgi:hypothetical protein